MQNIHPLVRAAAMLGAAAVCAVLSAARLATAGEGVDRVVASVDGDPITMHDVTAYSAAIGHPLPPDDVTASPAFKAVLKALIAQKLLQGEVRKYDDKVEDSQIDRYIQGIEHDRGLTDAQLRQSLVQAGVRYGDFRKQIRFEIEKALMFNDDLRHQVSVSASEVQAYYNAHKDEFMVKEERYKLAQILIAVPDGAPPGVVAAAQAKADALDKRARAGQDFAALAHENSDDASREQGGELGDFAPGEVMDKIFDAVKGLKPGQVSGVVRTQHGFHILKLEAHEVPGPKPFAEVKEEIRNKLTDEAARMRMQSWVERDLVKQHYVETMY